MESIDCWRLCDEMSIIQAALLIAGKDPSTLQIHRLSPDEYPTGYRAALTAICNAAREGTISAKIVPESKRDAFLDCWFDIEGTVDADLSIISVSSLKEFLRQRGVHKGFFFPDDRTADPDYMSPSNPYYAPKLAAAVDAWVIDHADSASQSVIEATGRNVLVADTMMTDRTASKRLANDVVRFTRTLAKRRAS